MDQIKMNEKARRFEWEVDGKVAYTEYILTLNRIVFSHTEVPVGLEGRGIGSGLAKHVLNYAKENNLAIVPLCPFVAGYIRKHPEFKEMLAPGFSV